MYDEHLSYVFTMTYKVLVNQALNKLIIPTRGLRQVDLLSCYLYIFSSNILYYMLLIMEKLYQINGFKFAKRALPITHLMYADDLLFFFRATLQECQQSLIGPRVLWKTI